jgi:hypothetical protein
VGTSRCDRWPEIRDLHWFGRAIRTAQRLLGGDRRFTSSSHFDWWCTVVQRNQLRECRIGVPASAFANGAGWPAITPSGAAFLGQIAAARALCVGTGEDDVESGGCGRVFRR